MKETGEMRDEMPVMEMIPDTSEIFLSVQNSIRNSFLDRFLDLYRLCQCYLIYEGELQAAEPAYLALTDHQGGFAKEGFILKSGDSILGKAGTPYVDITVESATGDISRLMSVTQLFPHEMAHVMYRLLSREDSLSDNNRSVDMHYFSIVTDYPTAFNEGFAEHMENVSRHYEENDSIRAGIREDLERIRKTSSQAIAGFTRDFKMPFRMGFYKAGMINWYQKYEDYKRSEFALSGQIRYRNKSLKLKDPEDRLSYRNAGVAMEQAPRNIVQLHSTEGAISAFFTALSTRERNEINIPDSLTDKLSDCGMMEPDQLQKQFLGYFLVFHNYVTRNNSDNSQFSDFIRGYLDSFPQEEEDVRRIYRDLTGTGFTADLPPSLWLMVTDHPHRLLALDPFGAIEVPLYTFNLNAAGVEDLLTIDALTAEEAELIIRYRDRFGYYECLDDVAKVPGLSPESAERIMDLDLEPSEFEQLLKDFNPDLNISKLIITPVVHILSKAFLYFGIFLLLIFYLPGKNGQLNVKKIVSLSLRYLFLWLAFVILEMAILFLFPQYRIFSILPIISVILFSLIFYRKKKTKRNLTFYMLSLMLLLSLVSVF